MVELLNTRLDALPAGETELLFRLGGPGEADGLLKAGEDLVPGSGLVGNTVEVSVRRKLGRAGPSCACCASCEFIVLHLKIELVGKVFVLVLGPLGLGVDGDGLDPGNDSCH